MEETRYCPVDMQDKTPEEIRSCKYLKEGRDCSEAYVFRKDGINNCLLLEQLAQTSTKHTPKEAPIIGIVDPQDLDEQY